MKSAILLINPFKGEDTVLNHLRFDFHGLVRLLQDLRLHFLPSSTVKRVGVSNQDFLKIIIYFFTRDAIKSVAPLISKL